MSETDNPLKLLITEFAEAFAAWLLPQPIQWIRSLPYAATCSLK